MVSLSKRVKRSHLTEREKAHTMGLGFLGVLLYVTAGIAAFALHVHVGWTSFIVAGLLIDRKSVV